MLEEIWKIERNKRKKGKLKDYRYKCKVSKNSIREKVEMVEECVAHLKRVSKGNLPIIKI